MNSSSQATLSTAIKKRDKALYRFQRHSQKAEQARERWIQHSTTVAILERAGADDAQANAPTRIEAANPVPSARIAVMKPDPLRGLCANVARQLGLTHVHVSEVAYGRRVSARVTEALRAEMLRMEARQERAGAA